MENVCYAEEPLQSTVSFLKLLKNFDEFSRTFFCTQDSELEQCSFFILFEEIIEIAKYLGHSKQKITEKI